MAFSIFFLEMNMATIVLFLTMASFSWQQDFITGEAKNLLSPPAHRSVNIQMSPHIKARDYLPTKLQVRETLDDLPKRIQGLDNLNNFPGKIQVRDYIPTNLQVRDHSDNLPAKLQVRESLNNSPGELRESFPSRRQKREFLATLPAQIKVRDYIPAKLQVRDYSDNFPAHLNVRDLMPLDVWSDASGAHVSGEWTDKKKLTDHLHSVQSKFTE